MTNTNFPKATIEGYPRVGANRELKRALESYWAGRIDAETFESAAHSLRLDTYNRPVSYTHLTLPTNREV